MFLNEFEKPKFPPVEFADENGLLAIGGKLSPEWLITAYSKGIFPWFDNPPVLWWSPDPRAAMNPADVKIHKSMRSYFNQNKYQIKIDTAFDQVIKNCATIQRPDQDGTWITTEMQQAYIQLHKLGYAHSFETWNNDILVGGLYGVSLGSAFFGESMFSFEKNASKFAFISLCKILDFNMFSLIDCQIPTSHLNFLGCKTIERKKFLSLLDEALSFPDKTGNWQNILKIPKKII